MANPAPASQPELVDQPPTAPEGIELFFVAPMLSLQDAALIWSRRTNTAVTSLGSGRLTYRPALLGQVSIRFLDRKTHVEEHQTLAYRVPDPGKTGLVHWSDFMVMPLAASLLGATPITPALFSPVPPGLADGKRLTALKADLLDYVYRSATLPLYHHAGLKLISSPGENQGAFLARLQAAAFPQGMSGQPQDTDKWSKIASEVQEVTLTPYKKDIALDQFGVVWLPGWQTTVNGQSVAFAAYTSGAANNS